jgi:uncharacterized protein YbcC (UPF0753/DUF2309 family)
MQVNSGTEVADLESQHAQSDRIPELIAKIALLLPPQGPVSAFIFLNILEALEDLPFEEGINKGARLFGCRPYLAEDQYRRQLANGRIRRDDLLAELRADLGQHAEEPIGTLGTRFQLRESMLDYPLKSGPVEELRWFVAETNALTHVRPEAPLDMRERLIASTRQWLLNDWEQARHTDRSAESHHSAHRLIEDLLRHYGGTIQTWTDDIWEEVSLRALWRVCREGVHAANVPWQRAELPIRHRDLLLDATGEDGDALVNDVLIRYCAAYADQGQADWELPHRDEGFYRAFLELYRGQAGPPNRWLHGLNRELDRICEAHLSPAESIQESLEALGVPPGEWEDFLTVTTCSLKGWAALLYQMDVRSDRVALPAKPGTLLEFVAVKLILERWALAFVAAAKLPGYRTLATLRSAAEAHSSSHALNSLEQRALNVFQLAQVLGWYPAMLVHLSGEDWTRLVAEIEAFNNLERRRVFHNAFERSYRIKALDAISVRAALPAPRVPRPRFQSCYCIDAREESFRRHLEEFAPDVETFAAPGFYGIPLYYKGVADAHFATLCPIVVRPKHWMIEEVIEELADTNRVRAQTRKAIGTASHRVHRFSLAAAAGAIVTATFGVLASIPLVFRVLFPWMTSRIRRVANELVAPPGRTRLRMERTAPNPGQADDEIGFTVEEMAFFGEKLIRDIGLTHNFSRLMIFFGHGSFCLNNPHKSAYDCGACTGPGGPNARALASMLNDPRVRAILASHGLEIPSDTVFLGGMHNTCEDTVQFYDLDLLPESHKADLESARQTLEEVCLRNAHERCRRFQSAPLSLSYSTALRHAEERAEDLSQTRPEYGNATNAVCFVGRRERVRGLYMDRRCFMHSYDPTWDDENKTILGRILAPVVPVCEGINLTYFFSYIDSPGWGAGTKLPHNVTSLLGVMDGYQSDLRCGLPFQSVEIHEPVRLLFVIEATPETMFKIMGRDKTVGRILRNRWAQLAILDPNSSEIRVFENGEFRIYQPETVRLPTAPNSLAWYQGHREHLDFALIDKGLLQAG